jgi:hypothetical protein
MVSGRRKRRHQYRLEKARAAHVRKSQKTEIKRAGVGVAGKAHKAGKAVKRANVKRKRVTRKIRKLF